VRRARGFSLVELLVAAAIVSMVLSLVFATFLSQQRSFTALDVVRISQEVSRDALFEIEGSLRKAGYGVDPTHALDFWYRCATQPCRDSATGPDTLVFVARNANYAWDGTTYSGNAWNITAVDDTSKQITFTSHGGETFYKGQVVLAQCSNLSGWNMGTVASTVAVATGTVSATRILLDTSGAAGDPYRQKGLSASCLATGGLFKIDRYGYSIASYPASDDTCRTPPCTEPFLVLDNGLDRTGDGIGATSNLIPIARGVEDMQVAYAYGSDPTNTWPAPDTTPTKNWVFGDYLSAACNLTTGAAGSGTQEEPSRDTAAYPPPGWPPAQGSTTTAANYNRAPANVRGIRISLTIRSRRPDSSKPAGFMGDPRLDAENRPCLVNDASLGGYRRFVVRSAVTLHNMGTSSPFVF
jgi:type IV pilus assembly protein PilW